jgi:hypothetical protein
MDDDPYMDTSRNLARWLQEAGRRTGRAAAASSEVEGKPGATHSWLSGAIDRGLERAKWPLLVALSACAFLQYFYMNVFLSIDSVRSVIVFVLVNSMLPPV